MVLLGLARPVILVVYLWSAASQRGSSALRMGRLSSGMEGQPGHTAFLIQQASRLAWTFLLGSWAGVQERESRCMQGLLRPRPGTVTFSHLQPSVGQRHRAGPGSGARDAGCASWWLEWLRSCVAKGELMGCGRLYSLLCVPWQKCVPVHGDLGSFRISVLGLW